ncbi:extracellular solute-binding protein [Pseudomonas sp. GCM10022188]|uniref:extracellular solute-binding protein n=1 Tax=Pseudomonas TaxID=286 RepID=UPI001E624561|nr:extracellular solute-binding protein [Pseudomonas oryzagri]MCC6076191.1 extracellular solute-binding protein [Pseudomonas oryzagri]
MNNKKWLTAPLLALSISAAQGQTLNVANWNDYIDPQVLETFTKETGIEVNYRTYEDDQEVYDLLKQGEALDVVVPSTDNFGKMVGEGLLQPYGASGLPGYEAMEPLIVRRLTVADPAKAYGVPYLWGSIGLAVNVPQAEAALGGPVPNTWGLVFDKTLVGKLSKCGVTLLDSPNDVLSLLANYRGRSLNALSAGYAERLFGELNELRPHYRYVDSERYIEDLNAGKTCVSMAWVGDALGAAAKGQPIKYLVPDEGTLVFVDILAIPKSAQHPEEAKAFISYLLRPEVSAQIARATYYQTPNVKARQLLESSGQDFHAAQLSTGMFGFVEPKPEVEKLVTDFWPRLQKDSPQAR